MPLKRNRSHFVGISNLDERVVAAQPDNGISNTNVHLPSFGMSTTRRIGVSTLFNDNSKKHQPYPPYDEEKNTILAPQAIMPHSHTKIRHDPLFRTFSTADFTDGKQLPDNINSLSKTWSSSTFANEKSVPRTFNFNHSFSQRRLMNHGTKILKEGTQNHALITSKKRQSIDHDVEILKFDAQCARDVEADEVFRTNPIIDQRGGLTHLATNDDFHERLHTLRSHLKERFGTRRDLVRFWRSMSSDITRGNANPAVARSLSTGIVNDNSTEEINNLTLKKGFQFLSKVARGDVSGSSCSQKLSAPEFKSFFEGLGIPVSLDECQGLIRWVNINNTISEQSHSNHKNDDENKNFLDFNSFSLLVRTPILPPPPSLHEIATSSNKNEEIPSNSIVPKDAHAVRLAVRHTLRTLLSILESRVPQLAETFLRLDGLNTGLASRKHFDEALSFCHPYISREAKEWLWQAQFHPQFGKDSKDLKFINPPIGGTGLKGCGMQIPGDPDLEFNGKAADVSASLRGLAQQEDPKTGLMIDNGKEIDKSTSQMDFRRVIAQAKTDVELSGKFDHMMLDWKRFISQLGEKTTGNDIDMYKNGNDDVAATASNMNKDFGIGFKNMMARPSTPAPLQPLNNFDLLADKVETAAKEAAEARGEVYKPGRATEVVKNVTNDYLLGSRKLGGAAKLVKSKIQKYGLLHKDEDDVLKGVLKLDPSDELKLYSTTHVEMNRFLAEGSVRRLKQTISENEMRQYLQSLVADHARNVNLSSNQQNIKLEDITINRMALLNALQKKLDNIENDKILSAFEDSDFRDISKFNPRQLKSTDLHDTVKQFSDNAPHGMKFTSPFPKSKRMPNNSQNDLVKSIAKDITIHPQLIGDLEGLQIVNGSAPGGHVTDSKFGTAELITRPPLPGECGTQREAALWLHDKNYLSRLAANNNKFADQRGYDHPLEAPTTQLGDKSGSSSLASENRLDILLWGLNSDKNGNVRIGDLITKVYHANSNTCPERLSPLSSFEIANKIISGGYDNVSQNNGVLKDFQGNSGARSQSNGGTESWKDGFEPSLRKLPPSPPIYSIDASQIKKSSQAVSPNSTITQRKQLDEISDLEESTAKTLVVQLVDRLERNRAGRNPLRAFEMHRILDFDKDGYITVEDLKKSAKSLLCPSSQRSVTETQKENFMMDTLQRKANLASTSRQVELESAIDHQAECLFKYLSKKSMQDLRTKEGKIDQVKYCLDAGDFERIVPLDFVRGCSATLDIMENSKAHLRKDLILNPSDVTALLVRSETHGRKHIIGAIDNQAKFLELPKNPLSNEDLNTTPNVLNATIELANTRMFHDSLTRRGALAKDYLMQPKVNCMNLPLVKPHSYTHEHPDVNNSKIKEFVEYPPTVYDGRGEESKGHVGRSKAEALQDSLDVDETVRMHREQVEMHIAKEKRLLNETIRLKQVKETLQRQGRDEQSLFTVPEDSSVNTEELLLTNLTNQQQLTKRAFQYDQEIPLQTPQTSRFKISSKDNILIRTQEGGRETLLEMMKEVGLEPSTKLVASRSMPALASDTRLHPASGQGYPDGHRQLARHAHLSPRELMDARIQSEFSTDDNNATIGGNGRLRFGNQRYDFTPYPDTRPNIEQTPGSPAYRNQSKLISTTHANSKSGLIEKQYRVMTDFECPQQRDRVRKETQTEFKKQMETQKAHREATSQKHIEGTAARIDRARVAFKAEQRLKYEVGLRIQGLTQ